MVARDGIEPPTPAFSGMSTELAKWFPMDVCIRGTICLAQEQLGSYKTVCAVFSPRLFAYCSRDSPFSSCSCRRPNTAIAALRTVCQPASRARSRRRSKCAACRSVGIIFGIWQAGTRAFSSSGESMRFDRQKALAEIQKDASCSVACFRSSSGHEFGASCALGGYLINVLRPARIRSSKPSTAFTEASRAFFLQACCFAHSPIFWPAMRGARVRLPFALQ